MMENLAPLAAAVVIVLAGLALLASLVVIAVRALRRHDAEAADKQLVELARLQTETAVRIEDSYEEIVQYPLEAQIDLVAMGVRAAGFGPCGIWLDHLSRNTVRAAPGTRRSG